MNITFLVGNGFDLNIGLKTRYIDFYEYYKRYASKDSVILQWMTEDNEKGDWADLEVALGNKVSAIGESDYQPFLDSLEELDRLLLEYLEKEENRYSVEINKEEILSELSRSIIELPADLNPVDKTEYKATCDKYRNTALKYCFITFNYTDILDQIVEKAKEADISFGEHTTNSGQIIKHSLGEVHHVHGTLTEGVALGVNDETQINNEGLRKKRVFKYVFIKPIINRQMGQRRTERAEQIINNSQIICIFGMSMGITDKYWWQKIITWLLEGENRKLIIYRRVDPMILSRNMPVPIIRAREEVRSELWSRGKGDHDEATFEKVRSRIIVIFNSNIFSFPRVTG